MKEQDYDQTKYIALDLDKFFRENDEFTMLKTLQEMYVSSYKLELEIKSLVTDELDSVLVFVDTILEMCSLIKGSKSNLDALSRMFDSFEFDSQFAEECRRKQSAFETTPNDLESRLNEWMGTFSLESIRSHTFDPGSKLEDLRKLNLGLSLEEFVTKSPNLNIQMALLASHHLNNLTMNNYRLLKTNQLVKSYEWLFVKAPVLLELIDRLQAAKAASLRSETERMCEFYRKKLKSHCLTNLGSNGQELVLESLTVLLLLDGKSPSTLSVLLRKRLELFNIATAYLAHGSLTSLSTLFSHFFVNELVLSVLAPLMASGSGKGQPPFSFKESHELKLLEHLNTHSLGKLNDLKRVVSDHIDTLDVAFTHLDPAFVQNTRASLKNLLENAWKKCATEKILNFMLTINVSINNRMKIQTDLGNFSEYFDNQEFEENTQCDLEAIICELNAFLDTEPAFNSVVTEKVNSMANKVNSHIKSREFRADGLVSLTLSSVQAHNERFKEWLEKNGLMHTLLLMNRLNRTENVDKLYKNIANKYLEPLVRAAEKVVSGLMSSLDNFDDIGLTDTLELQTDGRGEAEADAVKSQNKGNDEGLYMVMVVYAAANLKSFMDELNGFRRSVFTELLEESAAVAAMKGYLRALNSRTLPKQLELDASVLSFIWRDKFEVRAAGSNSTYAEYKSALRASPEHERFYAQFRALV